MVKTHDGRTEQQSGDEAKSKLVDNRTLKSKSTMESTPATLPPLSAIKSPVGSPSRESPHFRQNTNSVSNIDDI